VANFIIRKSSIQTSPFDISHSTLINKKPIFDLRPDNYGDTSFEFADAIEVNLSIYYPIKKSTSVNL